MASFRACNNKVKESTKSGAGTEDIYKPNWFAYERMASFLQNKNEARNTINSENLASQLSQDETTPNDVSANGSNHTENIPDNIIEIDENILNDVFLQASCAEKEESD
ncbi:unnamed protein product [Acanthoscelides obtectus]|uniref:MADF domain-containing protein n=1 Tax=Acanthoscelides obtectus TaxID=200917 RepID=A0A9P0PGB2_ACAOB|nr:unnamed protein product [Acanthoscelides obtectus]CAK1650026.1 hypothetical protein AOBTE_LOCUS16552 [Acanthoscelides obtectus]